MSNALTRDLLEAAKPFAEAFEKHGKWRYTQNVEHNPEDWLTFLDANTATPAMSMGDFRRAYEALTRAEAELAKGQGGVPSERRCGIIGTGRTIPWNLAERAYLGYSKKYGTQQSLERMAERGGFGEEELDEYTPGWRDIAFPLTAQANPTESPKVRTVSKRELSETYIRAYNAADDHGKEPMLKHNAGIDAIAALQLPLPEHWALWGYRDDDGILHEDTGDSPLPGWVPLYEPVTQKSMESIANPTPEHVELLREVAIFLEGDTTHWTLINGKIVFANDLAQRIRAALEVKP